MDTKCPYCGRIQPVPAEYRGRQVKCPSCSAEFPASAHKPPPPKPPVIRPPKRVPLSRTLPSSGIYSTLAGFFFVLSTLSLIAAFAGTGSDPPYTIPLCAIVVLLSLAVLAIATLIDAVNANTRHRENSEKKKKSS